MESIYNLLVQAPIIIFALDKEGKIQLSEGGGLAILGQKPGQTVGLSIFDLFKGVPGYEPYEEFADQEATVRKVLAGESISVTVPFRDKWLRGTLQPLRKEGVVMGMVGIVYDVTKDIAEQKLAQAESEEGRRLYMSLFETIPIGMGIADSQGNLLFFNRAMMQPGGYTREDIESIRNVARLYYDPAERDRALAQVKEHGFLDQMEVKFRKKTGGFYYALMSLRPVTYQNKPALLAVVQDISSRKLIEEDMHKRNEELENLNRLLVGREVKMAELKRELDKLKGQTTHGK